MYYDKSVKSVTCVHHRFQLKLSISAFYLSCPSRSYLVSCCYQDNEMELPAYGPEGRVFIFGELLLINLPSYSSQGKFIYMKIYTNIIENLPIDFMCVVCA